MDAMHVCGQMHIAYERGSMLGASLCTETLFKAYTKVAAATSKEVAQLSTAPPPLWFSFLMTLNWWGGVEDGWWGGGGRDVFFKLGNCGETPPRTLWTLLHDPINKTVLVLVRLT